MKIDESLITAYNARHRAPIVKRIERRFAEPLIQVRFLVGALLLTKRVKERSHSGLLHRFRKPAPSRASWVRLPPSPQKTSWFKIY